MRWKVSLPLATLLLLLAPAADGAQDRTAEFEAWLRDSLRSVLAETPVSTPCDPYWYGGIVYGGISRLATSLVADALAFSTSNLQQQGVDESDRVVFDGRLLYVAPTPQVTPGFRITRPFVTGLFVVPSRPAVEVDQGCGRGGRVPDLPVSTSVRMLRADDDLAAAQARDELEVEGIASIHGMYRLPPGRRPRSAARLVVVGSPDPAPQIYPWWNPWSWAQGSTRVHLYDLAKPAAPEAIFELEIEGRLVSSRRVGDMLHLVTRYAPLSRRLLASASAAGLEPAALADAPIADLMPRLTIAGRRTRSLVRPAQCLVAEAGESRLSVQPTLVTLTSIDLRRPSRTWSVCVGGAGEEIYSSTAALYLTSGSASRTEIHKFRYTDGAPGYRGSASVEGALTGAQPRFALGEHEGVLGLLTRSREEGGTDRHQLTLLAEARDGQPGLRTLARLPNGRRPAPIGKPDESVHGVRFIGDRVYVVTYRKIDPLYVIDRSNPRDPRIAGELQVPGFSDYLHPLGRDLLLGIGKDTISDVNNDWFQGIKVELFDVSDPGRLTSLDSLVIGARGSESAALQDHHAVAHLPGGVHRFAFPVQIHEGERAPQDPPYQWFPWQRTGLRLVEVDPGSGPAQARLLDAGEMTVERASSGSGGSLLASTVGDRAFIQGDAVHYVHGDSVWSAPWSEPGEATGPQ